MFVTTSESLVYLKINFVIALTWFVCGGVCESVPVCLCAVIRGQFMGGVQDSNSGTFTSGTVSYLFDADRTCVPGERIGVLAYEQLFEFP